jgi:hypothetical protein
MPDRPITGVDHDNKPLAIGERVVVHGTIKSMDDHGMVALAVDSSDGVHHYVLPLHCHCTFKE